MSKLTKIANAITANKATEIRNKIVNGLSFRTNPNFAEDVINTRIFSPVCVVDIAYGIWQESVLKSRYLQHKNKVLAKEITRKWSAWVYNEKGAFYHNLNTDDVYEISVYSDQLKEDMKQELDFLYLSIERKLTHVAKGHRDLLTAIYVVSVLLNACLHNMELDWRIKHDGVGRVINMVIDLYDGVRKVATINGNEQPNTCQDDVRQIIESINDKMKQELYAS